ALDRGPFRRSLLLLPARLRREGHHASRPRPHRGTPRLPRPGNVPGHPRRILQGGIRRPVLRDRPRLSARRGRRTSVPDRALHQRALAGELAAMTGGSPQILSALDSIFDELIAGDRDRSCSVVLLTSPADAQYLTEAAPLAGLLSGYENFFTVSTLSPLVTKHVDVTPYDVPLINALLLLA